MSRNWVRVLVTLAVGILMLAALFYWVHPDQIAKVLQGASPGWVATALALYLAFLILRGLRWWIILGASAGTRAADATAVTLVGWAVNSISPFKIGDVVRAATMAKRARIGIGEAGATVVVERVLDVFALLVLAIISAALSGTQLAGAGLWQRLAVISTISLLIGGAGFIAVRYEERTLELLTRWAGHLPPRLQSLTISLSQSALRGFRSLRSPRRLLTAAGLSLLLWTLLVFSSMAFFRAISPQVAPVSLFLALTLFTITQAISVTPGSLGTFELLYVFTLTAFGASPRSMVTAAALLSHLVGIAFLLLLGAAGALWLRLTSALPVGLQQPLSSQDRP
jgi:uncharacterized protein (TIRG00374 family)